MSEIVRVGVEERDPLNIVVFGEERERERERASDSAFGMGRVTVRI